VPEREPLPRVRRCETAGRPDGEGRPNRPIRARERSTIPCARWEHTILILCKILIYANTRSRAASFRDATMRRSRPVAIGQVGTATD
jgi:hypothetical protein